MCCCLDFQTLYQRHGETQENQFHLFSHSAQRRKKLRTGDGDEQDLIYVSRFKFLDCT